MDNNESIENLGKLEERESPEEQVYGTPMWECLRYISSPHGACIAHSPPCVPAGGGVRPGRIYVNAVGGRIEAAFLIKALPVVPTIKQPAVHMALATWTVTRRSWQANDKTLR